MKKLLLFSIALSGFLPAFAQKQTNAIVYAEHPALAMIDEFLTATIHGDPERIAHYLTDDFKFYNGTSAARYDPGIRRARFVKLAVRYCQEPVFINIDPFPDAHPDAVEYREDNNEEVWVQTWNIPKGFDKTTGVRLTAAAPRLYKVSKDNKIKIIINFTHVREQIGESYVGTK